MAPPLPADNFRQRQSITTAIKTICEYYPPNTCLRELLQNADDAGATEIEYVLDTKTYSDEPLLSDGLRDFQGPALLARNNSVFRDQDFDSLSTVGDSVKKQDPTATGKFGQGFNAVYHWTDGPVIYSRRWLLILDPHEWWSRESGQPGGPRWDVVDNYASEEVQNQLKAFDQIGLNPQEELSQTIIRIPLRNPTQAIKSNLFQNIVDVQDIRKALVEFGAEVKEGGILFLKHIRTVTIRINSDVLLKVEMLETSVEDARTRQQLPSTFHDLYAVHPPTIVADKFFVFELAIRSTEEGTSEDNRFVVQHAMLKSSGDGGMDEWARDRKLFPWVAIAAPLGSSPSRKADSIHGRLFTILRLPMVTDLPVHVHGLFSISPDRGRLSFTREADDATRWNRFMFSKCVALAWSKLLAHRKTISSQQEGFAFWPKPNFKSLESGEMWDFLDDHIIDMTSQHEYDIWNAANGCCVDIDTGYFAVKDSEAEKYGSALARFDLPAVYLEESFFKKFVQRLELLSKDITLLRPTTARQFLRSKPLQFVADEVASLVLEFCLLDATKSQIEGEPRRELYNDLEDIQLWPILTNELSPSRRDSTFLLPRDELESQLFAQARANQTLHLTKLSPAVQKLLRKDIEHLSVIMRVRNIDDLAVDWPIMYPMSSARTVMGATARLSGVDRVLRNVWTWISARIQQGGTINSSVIGHLQLLPVNDGRVRSYVTRPNDPPVLVIEPADALYKPLTQLASNNVAITPPLLDIQMLPSKMIKLFRNDEKVQKATLCTSIDHSSTFVDWLVAAKDSLCTIPDSDIEQLLAHLDGITSPFKLQGGPSSTLIAQLKRLPVFNKLDCQPPFRSQSHTRCCLDTGDVYFTTPANLPPLPDISGFSFSHPQSSAESSLIERLSAVENISMKDLVSRYLLEWMESVPSDANDDGGLGLVKYKLVDWIMKQASKSTRGWLSDVFSHPIIPLPPENGKRRYRCLAGMVDKDTKLGRLHYEDEGVFPCPELVSDHRHTLRKYGLVFEPSWDMPMDRIRLFSNHWEIVGPDYQKLAMLLDFTVHHQLIAIKESSAEVRTLKWLPGRSTTGENVILAPNQCRHKEDAPLVDFVLGITDVNVTPSWKRFLGWDKKIENKVLLQQLDECLLRKEYSKARKVLLEIDVRDCTGLQTRKCLLGRGGAYYTPSEIFRPGSLLAHFSLAPYLDEIDSNLASDLDKLLSALEVRTKPSLEDIQAVQSALQERSNDDPLDLSAVQIAVATLEIAVQLRYDVTDVLVPDTRCRLRELKDIVHGDPLALSGHLDFTHPKVSADLATRLGVENALARAIRLRIDLDDDDENEFTPQESLRTVISDTLERYPIATTFNEFLANADDAKATKIVWTLDECSDGHHASASLLTTELKDFQGPALLVYNDGVFSKDDFAGLKDIGQGGKHSDRTSTGMFGRGALSMYHFTDVPMLLSNDSFLVLDPRQECLPISYRNRRKRRVGSKMSLSDVNSLAPDQLEPFYGLHGFDRSVKEIYQGTIFRFPLRKKQPESPQEYAWRTIDEPTLKSMLLEYLETARIALLFLRHIELIEFRVRGDQEPEWTVSAKRSSLENENFHLIEVTTSKKSSVVETDTWCVGLKDIQNPPSDIFRTGKGFGKSTECGVAACLQYAKTVRPQPGSDVSSLNAAIIPTTEASRREFVHQRVFCRLPTAHPNSLPISFHASFAVTGDRKAIALEESAENAAWNRWLLETCLSTFYIEILQYLAPRLGNRVFEFWPVDQSSPSSDTVCQTLSHAFWDKFAKPDDHLGDLFPIAAQGGKYSDSAHIVGSLDPSYKTTNIIAARFDFLSEHKSKELTPLLLRTFSLLVRPPPTLRTTLSSSSSRLKTIDSQFLGDIFRIERHCTILEEFIAELPRQESKCSLMARLLEAMIPRNQAAMTTRSILDGCRIIPRPDFKYPLGTLSWDSRQDSLHNFHATPREQELFGFAADRMVHTDLFPRPNESLRFGTSSHHDPIVLLLEADCNIHCLRIEDTGSLLRHAGSPVHARNKPEWDVWLQKSWNYLNTRLNNKESTGSDPNPMFKDSINKLLEDCGLPDLPIYRTRKTQKRQYLTPQEFQVKPTVVQPLDGEHYQLCEQIPGLLCIDRDCIPFMLREKETDLQAPASFGRFLRSLHRLEEGTRVSAKTIVGGMSHELRDTLKDLALNYLADNPCDNILQKVPIWPRLMQANGPPREHIAAEDAMFCCYRQMLLPWVRTLASFVDPELVWNATKNNLPSDLTSVEVRQQYCKFIEYLTSYGIRPSGRIAPNGSSLMCEPNSLYDHDDPIFAAAFREQKMTKFLHKDIQVGTPRSIWIQLGLQARSSINTMDHVHYLDCARAINRRWDPASTTSSFTEDAGKVSAYLQYHKPEFSNWPRNIWNQISSLQIFRVQGVADDEMTYRRQRMHEIARQKTHCTLTEAAKHSDCRILWSQTRFLSEAPADFVFQQLPQGGRPSCTQVFDQLKFLMEVMKEVQLSEIPELLLDVQACYDHLQSERDATKAIPGIQTARIWLNLDTTQLENVIKEQLHPSLTAAKILCLNSQVDAPPLKNTNKFLIPYETLLVALGCMNVVQPNFTTTSASLDSRELSLVAGMAEMRSLRDKEELVDVVFEAEGQRRSAHRIVLAAVSEYCKGQFSGAWGRTLKHNSIVTLQDFRFLTLSQMIDFAYTGDFKFPELRDKGNNDEIGTNLGILLDLLDGTNMWLLNRLHEMTDRFLTSKPHAQIYVRLDTVIFVKERAEEARAERLVKYCEEFLNINGDYVEKFMDKEEDK